MMITADSIAHAFFQNYKNTFSPHNIGLFSGKTGNLLFLHHYAMTYDNAKANELLLEGVNDIIDQLNEGFFYPTYSGGLSGFLCFMHYLSRHGNPVYDDLDDFHIYDDMLYDAMDRFMDKGEYDFLHGAIGISYYFLYRYVYFGQSPAIKLKLERLAEQLLVLGAYNEQMLRYTSIISIKSQDRAYNLGLSHGMASIILFASLMIKAGLAIDICTVIINKSYSYYINIQQNQEVSGSFYPSYVTISNHVPHKSRLAWCYGDLGILTAMLHAQEHITDACFSESLLQEQIKVLCKRQNIQSEMVFDAGFCHGSAGNAAMYSHLYQLTGGMEICADAMEFWYKVTIDFYETHNASFPLWNPDLQEFVSNAGLLEGAVGATLSLMNRPHQANGYWTELFMLPCPGSNTDTFQKFC